MTLLTAAQVAPMLGLSRTKVYDLERSGELPGYRFGTAVRFDPQQVQEYVKSCQSRATKRQVDSYLNLTVSSTKSESGLENFFREAGIKVKRTHTTGKNQQNFTPSSSESKSKVIRLTTP